MSNRCNRVPRFTSTLTEPPSAPYVGLSLKAVFMGAVLVIVVCLVVTYAELVIAHIQIGFLQMPPVVIGVFFFLLLLSNGLRAIKRRIGLSAPDMVTIYCMMLVASMVSSRGIMEKVVPLLVVPNYFANPTNRWQNLFYPHIRRWFVPFDPSAGPGQFVAVRFYERLRAGESIPWDLWITPILAWGFLVSLVVFAFLCITAILRK